ncbi:MAG: hypothetical protein QOC94_2471 [Actinoplanes sp.]|nr:hypothetical protein [Actinoplanes sp.]
MVLTWPVDNGGFAYTRRTVLGTAGCAALSVTALSACGPFDDDDEQPKTADPLQPVLAAALSLAADYDRAALAQPGLSARLAPLAADHRAHAAELARLIGEPVPSAATSAPPTATSAPPTATTAPPTATSAPPTATSAPPTATTAPPTATSPPLTVADAATVAALRKAEQSAQKAAAAACRGAAAARAALLGSIAACRATHAEALR